MADGKIDDPEALDALVGAFLEVNINRGADARTLAGAMLFNAMDALLHLDNEALVKNSIDTLWGLAKQKRQTCGCTNHNDNEGTPHVH